MPDLNMQLEVWTQEVLDLLASAETLLALQDQEFHRHMVQAAPSARAAASLDWQATSSSSSQGVQHSVQCMRNTLGDAVANVQRLYDK